MRSFLDLPNWQANVDSTVRNFKRNMLDKGSVRPLQGAVAVLFVFNFLYSLPREMAHNQHEEDARFRRHH